ncbi:hypothetical protein [Bradyrhizobium sp.]|uniref:hypothetical protein n=1 Tax=Bradyrhizobium sp. TaxID=376 RepID=UPI00238916D5|nr:hypothetical protein [Bradyrhizobium sp.]MDE2380396.1 hypothetical protein [Bradyrhizobium sp.]
MTSGENKAAPPGSHNTSGDVRRARFELNSRGAKICLCVEFRLSRTKTGSNARARFWFQLVETMFRNHIDERQLNGTE